jgi:hypothetical protein
VHYARDKNTGSVDLVGFDGAAWVKMLDLDHRMRCCGCHDRVEIAGGLSEYQIAFFVAPIGMNERQVSEKTALKDERFAVERLRFLPIGDARADACFRVERRYPGPSCPYSLS